MMVLPPNLFSHAEINLLQNMLWLVELAERVCVCLRTHMMFCEPRMAERLGPELQVLRVQPCSFFLGSC